MSTLPIKEGLWLYEGTAPVHVLIEEVDCMPGSGDYEDSPEDREDRIGRFFHIAYSAAGEVRISNGRGYFTSLEEAVREAEQIFKSIQWK